MSTPENLEKEPLFFLFMIQFVVCDITAKMGHTATLSFTQREINKVIVFIKSWYLDFGILPFLTTIFSFALNIRHYLKGYNLGSQHALRWV